MRLISWIFLNMNLNLHNILLKYDNYVLSELQILEKAKTRKNKTNNFIKDICKQIEYYLDGNLKEFQVDYIINGTNYQKKVLEAVSSIKYSETL